MKFHYLQDPTHRINCLVYLPTFTIKIKHSCNVGKYTILPLDPPLGPFKGQKIGSKHIPIFGRSKMEKEMSGRMSRYIYQSHGSYGPQMVGRWLLEVEAP